MITGLKPTLTMILMLDALWECSKSLVKILPFKQKQERCRLYQMEEKISMCKTLYMKSVTEGTVRFRERLQPTLLNYLGMSS